MGAGSGVCCPQPQYSTPLGKSAQFGQTQRRIAAPILAASQVRLLVPTTVLPHRAHTVRAANVVLFEILAALVAQPDVELIVLPVSIGGRNVRTREESEGLVALRRFGATVLSDLVIPSQSGQACPLRLRLWKAALAAPDLFYPIVRFRREAETIVQRVDANVILTVWSEILTALFADARGVKVAYYGNPDPKSQRARLRFGRRYGMSTQRYLRGMLAAWMLERSHLREIRKWDLLANVAANDADYYRKKGHPNAFYMQNVWIDRGMARTPASTTVPGRIVASIGKLNGTANSYGFEYLWNLLLPELRAVFHDLPFELHIFGAGDLHPALAPLFSEPEVRYRGFVDDIDAELARASVFLCVNNATEYNVGHTRYLHAWSLGRCVVAHVNVRQAMPEFKHGKNALLGATPQEIARYAFLAATDGDLRRRLGEAGYRTFVDYFTAGRVVDELMHRIRRLVGSD